MTAFDDQLLARADIAIAEAIDLRVTVQAGLMAARQRRPYWPTERLSHPTFPKPVDWDALEPWWSVARTLRSASEIVRAADAELERQWQRILPTIESPTLLQCD